MKYLLTGGGTGGHVYPALAIANEIRQTRTDAEFLYVGHRDRLDAWVVPEQGYSIRFVRARSFPRTRSLVPLLRFASVYIKVSRSGEMRNPRCSKSSAVLPTTVS